MLQPLVLLAPRSALHHDRVSRHAGLYSIEPQLRQRNRPDMMSCPHRRRHARATTSSVNVEHS